MADTKASAFSGIGTWTALADGDLFPFVDISGTGAAKNSVATYLEIKTALSTVLLPKAGGTMTGAIINSTNGAASAPSLLLSGTPFTGGSATTTKPLVNIETAGATSTGWSTGGTMLGVNAASGFAGNLADWQLNGTRLARVDATYGLVAPGLYSDSSLVLAPSLESGGAYLTLGQNLGSIGNVRTQLADSHSYLWSSYQLLLANGRADAADCGVKWGAAGVVKITDGLANGYGTLDAAGFKVSGVAGANFSGVATNITVVNGLITAIS